MSRTDRLYAMREELRRTGSAGRTAEQLARTFEISVRTVKRDVATLQRGGFPVWARPGPGGGYAVDPTATLPPLNFSETEILGLAAAVASLRGQPFHQHAQAVLTKVLGVTDRSTRERAKALTDRVWTNRPAQPDGTGRITRAIERGIQEGRALDLEYHDENGSRSVRRVDPVFIAHTDGQWYLVAQCRTSNAIRWFRFDRALAVRVLNEAAVRVSVESVGVPPTTARALGES